MIEKVRSIAISAFLLRGRILGIFRLITAASAASKARPWPGSALRPKRWSVSGFAAIARHRALATTAALPASRAGDALALLRARGWSKMRPIAGLVRTARNGSRAMASKVSRQSAATAAAALLLALAGCSSPNEQASDSDLRTKLRLTKPDWAQTVTPTVRAARPLGPDDFVGPDGRCAGDPAPAEGPSGPGALYFQAGPEAGPAPAPPAPGSAQTGGSRPGRGIALEMSECDLVRAAGYTGQVEISTNERGERSVVLTYLQGEHPGIYRFVSGRLKSIERAPELPAAAKPAPAKKPTKKPAAS
jgi:hypothetical protein